MLENPNNFIHETDIKVEDIVKEADMRTFFMEDIDKILALYSPGKLENKPDVIEHMDKLKREREALMKKNMEDMEKVEAYKKMIMNSQNSQDNKLIIDKYNRKINDMMLIIQELTTENKLLKETITRLENKL